MDVWRQRIYEIHEKRRSIIGAVRVREDSTEKESDGGTHIQKGARELLKIRVTVELEG